MHFDQSCPSDSSAASVLVLALYSIVRQPTTTLLRENISAGALEVKHFVIEGIVMWITADGAPAFPHCLAGELKGSGSADLGKGARLAVTLQACRGARAFLSTGSVAPERVTLLHGLTFEGMKSFLKFIDF